MQRSFWGHLSVACNRLFGGRRGESLCGRIARCFGPYCWFCRVIIGWRNPWHCRDEMTAAGFIEWLRRK
jgi:hypothetical protein